MPTAPSPAPFQGRHFELIKNALPEWAKALTPERIRALKLSAPKSPAPYPDASPEQHQSLKNAVADHLQAQTALDKRLGKLNDVRAFAEQMLKDALRPDYGEIDVRNTWLRVYVDAPKAWWVLNIMQGVQSKTFPLLDMALHNFAAGDTFVDHAFLGPEDARGQRKILSIPHRLTGQKLTAEGFKAVCRSLDIGAQYQLQLRAALGFTQAARAGAVRDEVVTQLKADFRSSVHLGLHNKHLPGDTHQALLAFIENPQSLALDGHKLGCYTLTVAGCQLTGILLIFAPADSSSQRVIAWVPQDPEHPIKQYPSTTTFIEELTRQLRSGPAYQGFFSQFVAHAERGAFFSQVNARTPLKTSRLDITQDHANRAAYPKHDTPWDYLHRVKLNKIVNDARELAVSTAYVDRLARWAWWDNLEQMVSDVLNAALLVVTPFVPVLGQMMLAYGAYQLCNEVFEGLLDWAQGRFSEAAEHLLGVTENLIQLALFGVAGEAAKAAYLKLSPFVEGLHPVQRADGKVKLWNPDLAPYAQVSADLPEVDRLVSLDDQHYQVRHNAEVDEHRIVHPTRPHAYQPRVVFNDDGAFVHEGEQPQRWDSQTLMRRLGPRVKGFSDSQLADVRIASGTDEGVLRAMYCNNEPMPPLLDGGLKRLEAQAFPEAVSRKVRTGEPLPDGGSMDWLPQFITELPGWPSSKAVKVYLNDDLTGPVLTHGNANATKTDTLSISVSQALSGTLPEQVLAFLDETEIRTLLKGNFAREYRIPLLREKLAAHIVRQAPEVSDLVYQIREITDDPRLATLREPYAEVNSASARALLASATAQEREALSQRQLPLRLRNQAREVAFANQTVLAFEGLANASPLPIASERMALNTLKFYSDTFGQLRIEIREDSVTGQVLCAAGSVPADTTRVLVRTSQGYEVIGASTPPARTDLYQAILRALPDDRREALGVQQGDGAALKQWIKQRVESLAERRIVLAEPPVPRTQPRETDDLLGGAAYSRCRNTPAQTNLEHARATLQLLFPRMSEARLSQFLDEIPAVDLRNTLNTLVEEKQKLHAELHRWKSDLTDLEYPGQLGEIIESKKLLALKLERCWSERFAEYTDAWGHVQHGAVLNISHIPLPPNMPSLSSGFDHVTVLVANNCGLRETHSDFLNSLPSLRGLDLANNRLTQIPSALQQMRFVRDLKLKGNRLELTGDDVTTLGNLRHLKGLDLSNNPLTQAPDIKGMPGLRRLYLANTPLDTWPEGLFALPRTEDFVLDLHNTRVTRLPAVEAGSAKARIVARTRLDRSTLDEEERVRYEALRADAGLDPNRTYEPIGNNTFWLDGMDAEGKIEAKALWDAVENEHDSQGFFEVIESLQLDDKFQDEADRARYYANRPLLNQQVWRLLRAAHADTGLRERLFKMASFPGRCPDAGAQIFNEMGIEVMAYEIARDTANATELEGRLVTLAKGSAHLKLLAKVAGEDIALRVRPIAQGGQGQRFSSDVRDGVPGQVDEVDVHLAYQTALADRLDLPWLSDHMLYRATADVSRQQIEQAHTAVLKLDEGDGLVNQMLLETWWEQHLRDAYDNQCSSNEEQYSERFLALDDLQTAQARWVDADKLESAERENLRATLKVLADTVQVPEKVVFSGEPMDDERYNRLLNDLGYNQKECMRRLTREALAHANGHRNRSR